MFRWYRAILLGGLLLAAPSALWADGAEQFASSFDELVYNIPNARYDRLIGTFVGHVHTVVNNNQVKVDLYVKSFADVDIGNDGTFEYTDVLREHSSTHFFAKDGETRLVVSSKILELESLNVILQLIFVQNNTGDLTAFHLQDWRIVEQ